MIASALLLTAISGSTPADITPASLATSPQAVAIGDLPYDWTLQQRFSRSAGTKVADSTANCKTGPMTTTYNANGDSVHDCGFD
jgi:hypothetical protein